MLRPSAVYGFGMRHPIFVKPMVEDAVRGRPTRFANGREFPRDFTHVADVAQLTVRAVDAPAEGVRDRLFYYLDADGVQDMYFECEQAVQALVDLRAGKDVPATIPDKGLVVHQGNLQEAAKRMWGANVKK